MKTMKTTVLFKQNLLKFVLLTMVSVSGVVVHAQQELQFKNSTLQSGTAGADNAVYRFPDIDATHDALVTIKGRSSALTTLSSIDLTSTGFSKSFQPQVKYNGGSVSSASSWWMEFEIKFVNKGTSTAATLSNVYATGIDIDGDDNTLREFNTFYGSNYYVLEASTQLAVTNVTGIVGLVTATGKKFTGITTTHSGIDTSATSLMTTNVYVAASTIVVRVGASTTSGANDTDRMHSIWFKNFTYASPFSTVPVKLSSFTATLTKNNKVDLKWTTASEINVSHFVVERSVDGVNYSEAGVVFAYGNATDKTNYTFSDNVSNIQLGVVYYRLRSVDLDGKGMYSETRIIKIGKQAENMITITAFPNPVTNEVRIAIPAEWQNKKVIYEVVNANGQVAKKTETASSSQVESINTSNLSRGFYVVRVSCEGQTVQQKIVKN